MEELNELRKVAEAVEHLTWELDGFADGTWSDGVDRTYTIPSHRFSKANPDRVYVHTTYDRETLGKWQPLFDVWQGDAMLECELSYAEAIAYADRMARTNQGVDQ